MANLRLVEGAPGLSALAWDPEDRFDTRRNVPPRIGHAGVISAWNLDAGLKTCRLWSQTDGPARQFSLSPDGQWLAVILEDGQVLLRRLPGPDPH